MDIYIYLGLILALIFFSYETLRLTIQYCPSKIKQAVILIFILLSFRIVTIWMLLLMDNIKLVYLGRNLVFLNFIYIPMILFLCIFIFYRNKIINLKWIYYIFFMSILFYLGSLIFMPMEFYISTSYGYNIVLGNMLPYKILLCFGGLGFFIAMKGFMYKYSVKWGMALIIAAALVFIVTAAFVLKSTENIGFLLIGELALVITLYSGIRTFIKK